MNSMPEDNLSDMLANPFYIVVFADYLFKERELITAQEDWVLLNVRLIDDLGTKEWLGELLDVLTLDPKDYDGHDIINPSLATRFSNRLKGDHEPLVTREQWIHANTKLIKEIGSNKWLWKLLETLETGGLEVTD